MRNGTSTKVIDDLIVKAQRRVSAQYAVTQDTVGTDRHEADVRLLLIFQDILFEMEEARRILRRVGPPSFGCAADASPSTPPAL